MTAPIYPIAICKMHRYGSLISINPLRPTTHMIIKET